MTKKPLTPVIILADFSVMYGGDACKKKTGLKRSRQLIRERRVDQLDILYKSTAAGVLFCIVECWGVYIDWIKCMGGYNNVGKTVRTNRLKKKSWLSG